jgi:hypothetical protein
MIDSLSPCVGSPHPTTSADPIMLMMGDGSGSPSIQVSGTANARIASAAGARDLLIIR